jgi:O-antigen ligase
MSVLAVIIGVGDPRSVVRGADPWMTIWIFLVAGWPFIVIFLIAPLIWSSVDESGKIVPAMAYFPPAFFSIGMFVVALRGRFDIHIPSAMIATLFVFGFVSVWSRGLTDLDNLGLAVALFVGLLLRGRRTTLTTLSAGALLSAASVVLSIGLAVTTNGGLILTECRADKCAANAGEVITSPFAGNGNVLGLALACLIPFACARLPLWRTVLFVGGVAAILVTAGSRTAMIGLCVVGVALVAVKATGSPQVRAIIASAALLGGLGVSLYPMSVTFTGSSFAGRGYIWDAGREAIGEEPVFGNGPGYWSALAHDALFPPNYSPHNGWYDILVSFGICGLMIIVAAVVVQVRTTSRESLPYLLIYYGGIMTLNAFESIFVPYWAGITPLAAILPLMLYDPKPPADPELESCVSVLRIDEASAPLVPEQIADPPR